MSKKEWTAERVQELMLLAQPVGSLNVIVSAPDGDGEIELGAIVEDSGPSPEELVIEADRSKILREYIAKYLDPREAKVIAMRFGFETGSPMTLEEIGAKYNITRERVRQVEQKALNKLRCRFAINKIRKEDL